MGVCGLASVFSAGLKAAYAPVARRSRVETDRLKLVQARQLLVYDGMWLANLALKFYEAWARPVVAITGGGK